MRLCSRVQTAQLQSHSSGLACTTIAIKMAMDNFIFAQCILYFLAFVFGFIAVIPLSENTDDFRGKCLLFTRGMWVNENITVSKQRFIIEEWGPQSSCSFITAVGIASLILSAVQAWRLLLFICKGHDEWGVIYLILLHEVDLTSDAVWMLRVCMLLCHTVPHSSIFVKCLVT